jgi:hypothetical protein
MTKKKVKGQKLRELLSEVWFYVSEAVSMLLGVLVIIATSIAGVVGAIWLAIAPMQYWSPWWGFISIPVVAVVGTSLILWRVDRNG